MAGINRITGKPLDGVAHMFQSLQVIATTSRGTRVERRNFGNRLPRLVDRSISPLTLIDFYAELADVVREEPRFRLARMNLSEESDIPNGNPVFDIEGIYYPRGHLGDFTEARDVRGRIVL